MSSQLHAPAALFLGKEPLVPRGGWMGPRTGMDDVERRKILPLPGLELWAIPAPIYSLLMLFNLFKDVLSVAKII
jgi:hypothetical protein